jgi:hypothetical protein
MPPADEETEAGFRVLVKQTLLAIKDKLCETDLTRQDHEDRLRNLERRALIAFGFALCLSSLSAIATAIQFFTR